MIEITLSATEPLPAGFHPVPDSTAHLHLSPLEAWLAGQDSDEDTSDPEGDTSTDD